MKYALIHRAQYSTSTSVSVLLGILAIILWQSGIKLDFDVVYFYDLR